MPQGRRWTVADAAGRPVYLTEERWNHICSGHSEMVDYESALRATIRRGRRIQDPEKPQKFFYQLRVPNLPEYYTHIEAIVLFRFRVSKEEDAGGANNYVVTAYPTKLR